MKNKKDLSENIFMITIIKVCVIIIALGFVIDILNHFGITNIRDLWRYN